LRKTSAGAYRRDKEGAQYRVPSFCRKINGDSLRTGGRAFVRVPKAWVSIIAKEIIEDLLEKKLIELDVSRDEAVKLSDKLIFEELTVEDRLNEEVRGLLKKYDSEIEKGRLDYRKLFDLTKQKLVKERNIVL
jgi:hypothetical protein